VSGGWDPGPGARRAAGRLAAAAQNALEVARFGGLNTGDDPSPYEVVTEERVYRLRRYFPGRQPGPGSRPLVLVPPLMLACEVYDVSPATSAVSLLSSLAVDVYVVDFGAPEREEGGLERNLADHVLAVSDAVDHLANRTGGAVHLGGYSQGGMFCYQAAAYRQSANIASVVTFGSPVDAWAAIPFGLPEEVVAGFLGTLTRPLPRGVTVPGWMARTGFRMLDPVKSLRSRWDFARQLGDRDALMAREGQRRFLESEGWVAWPGPAMADLLRDFVTQNRMLSGGFVIGDHTVTLADITCPVLCFVGSTDQIGTPGSVRAIRQAAPRAHSYEIVQRAGHFGLVVGSHAADTTWPAVAAWTAWQDGTGPRPDGINPLTERPALPSRSESVLARSAHLAQLAADVGVGAARSAAEAGERTGHLARRAVGNVLEQLPRLSRLEGIGPDSHISIGLLLAEQVRHHPEQTCFLFEDRAHSYRDANRRIDAVVRGLLTTGARQGERIGVLMSTRPSALAMVAALSRLGAVAVMLRPDGAPAEEAELGAITRLVTDPEHVEQAREATPVPIHVLGGAGRLATAGNGPPAPRDLGPGVEDLEAVDPDAVRLPGWYHPNSGRGRDLAVVLFSGEGRSLRASHITNRRWAVSAFGTASAAALGTTDTIYSLSAFHHPAGLLTGLGGALASGARLALASHADPATFWAEVRRYGVTAVTYTWAMVHELLVAPVDPGEHHHPIRLWLGSGMPANLWRQVQDRFAPSRVVEFYASTEAEAVLANVTGRKVGAKGRPLPGSARIRLAAYDPAGNRLVQDDRGFAVECDPGQVGMLLAQPRDPADAGTVLRGVFARDDRWVSTGDLFRRDGDGDFWLVDNADRVVLGPDGPAYAYPVEDALATLRSVDLIAAFAARPTEPDPGETPGDPDVLAAAVTLRPGRDLTTEAINGALEELPAAGRPAWVALLDELPLTAWFRPRKTELGAAGPPRPGDDGVLAVWRLEQATGRYRKLPAPRTRRVV
jgi:putative long chain acyl-CoA synthase